MGASGSVKRIDLGQHGGEFVGPLRHPSRVI